MTVLLTTHYLEEADRLAAQLAIVDRGKVVATGSPDELKRELSGDAVQVELEQPGLNGARPALEALGHLLRIGAERVRRAQMQDTAASALDRDLARPQGDLADGPASLPHWLA